MEKELAGQWLTWMLETHIPEVMATGCFLEFKVMKLLTAAPDDHGVNYAIQYTANSIADYEKYRDLYGPVLQQKTRDRYGESIVAFRSLLEVVSG